MKPRGIYKSYHDVNSKSKGAPRSTTKYQEKISKKMSEERLEFKVSDESRHIYSEFQLSNDKQLCETSMQNCEEIIDENQIEEKLEETFAMESEEFSTSKLKHRRQNGDITENLVKKMSECNNINAGEILAIFMTFPKKHSWTWESLLDIFQSLNFIFKKKILPQTKYMLKKFMNVNTDNITYHSVCTVCHKYFGSFSNKKFSEACSNCISTFSLSSTNSLFSELDISDQLKKLFYDPIVVDSLEERWCRQKKQVDALEDIFDGLLYKKLCNKENMLKNQHNFSYTFNTDGCQAADNSKVTVWPIYIMLHELPDYLRKKHTMLIGLWVAKQEPDMTIFLQPFVNQANKLPEDGFKWENKGKEIISKLFPITCCVDSPARCVMLNMKRFNGIHGCTYREYPTVNIDNVRKYPMIENFPKLRTDESVERQMALAYYKYYSSTQSKQVDVLGV
ncbi:hypothetical protein TKK_0010255 [Trichogramma kaykai]|uniref:Uncharacterized protein n=1 Tax=Trichogramma kaykai TaxID=54128 RepID=A0ABD2WYY5_9HYME